MWEIIMYYTSTWCRIKKGNMQVLRSFSSREFRTFVETVILDYCKIWSKLYEKSVQHYNCPIALST